MRRGMEVFLEWVDELARAHAEREALLAEVADRALLAADAEPSPAVIVRWACDRPTEPPLGGYTAIAKLADDVPFGELLRRYLQMR